MESAGDEMLKAEILRLKEVMAVKDQLLAAQGQLLASSKDSNRAHVAAELEQYAGADPLSDNSLKRQRLHNSSSSSLEGVSPLDKDEVLDQIFSYVGGGDHLYVGGVSRRWRGRYMQYCAQASTCAQDIKCVTRYRSTIVSESRLLHAKANEFRLVDLDITQGRHAKLICQHSLEPERVITVLRLHNVAWNNVICREAAYHSKLSLLQWLHHNDCDSHEVNVLVNASRGGSVSMLEWLAAVSKPWSKSTKQEMLTDAACCDKLAAAQWLRERGAAWPAKFADQYEDAISTETVKQCWSLSAVQWAVTAGSGWLKWKCEDYAAGRYCADDKQQATDVLNWAHANGCPCTCGYQQQQQ
jgi:hypothetical protein